MALTSGGYSGTIFPMKTAADFNKEFAGRVRELRAASGLTQLQMADALGIGFEAYRKYEVNIMMPHRLLHQFALICRTDLHYLITGRSKDRAARQRA